MVDRAVPNNHGDTSCISVDNIFHGEVEVNWIKTPEVVCECVRSKGYEVVCDMHLRSGYGKMYKEQMKIRSAKAKREIAYMMEKKK